MTAHVFLLPIYLLTVISALRPLELAQHNGYWPAITKKELGRYALTLAIRLVAACTVIATDGLLRYAFIIIFTAVYVGLLTAERKLFRTKAVYTPRFVRLTVLFCVVVAVPVMAVARHLSYNNYPHFAAFLLLAEPLAFLALLLASPIEKLNGLRYVRRAKKVYHNASALKIGVTGSAGKTSVKELLASILSVNYSVLASKKNFNTPLGLALTAKEYSGQQVIIVEMGARHTGDIKKLCDIVRPDIGVVLNVLPQHLKTFGTIANIAKEKGVLATMATDFAVVSGLNTWTTKMTNPHKTIVVPGQDISIENVNATFDGTSFCYCSETDKTDLFVPAIGPFVAQNAAIAVAAALSVGVSMQDIATGLKNSAPTKHRFQKSVSANGVTIIDDSYNSNVAGVFGALSFIRNHKGRKIILAQGVVDLGRSQYAENVKIGEAMAKVADAVIILGVNRTALKEGFTSQPTRATLYEVKDLQEAQELFPSMLATGDVLYIQNDLPEVF